MPTYMDRHDLKGLPPEQIAQAHDRDMVLQEQHNVRFLTYWFDERESFVFCLVDAPSPESLRQLHAEAHGDVPGDIIEVNLDEVRAFLGRTSDDEVVRPDDADAPFTLNDTAFRVIMFTDLQDSTALSMRLGDRRMFELLAVHDEICRHTIADHEGSIVKHTGDGFMTSFRSVSGAVACAIALQRSLAAHREAHPDEALHIRIGLNAGYPVEHDGDLFGITVQMAARVLGHTRPDQIMATGIIGELCTDAEMATVFSDAGRATMKGFPSAVQLLEIAWR